MSLSKSVSSEIAAFFSDPDGSSIVMSNAAQITAPMVSGAGVTPEEVMTGGIRIVMYVIDASPSMSSVADELRNGFTDEFIPAIQEAREDDISALRIGGIAFAEGITPIWKKSGPNGDEFFHSIDQFPPLTKAEFDPEQTYSTALHQGILDGTARAVTYAARLEQELGVNPDVDVVVLSDGMNNCAPRDPSTVRTMVKGADKVRVRFTFLYFDTDGGRFDAKTYAIKELGFESENVETFMAKPGETPAQRRSRFRRFMQVASRVSGSKATSAVKASAAVTASADEDIV